MDTQTGDKKTKLKPKREPKSNPELFRICTAASAVLGVAGAATYFFAYVNDYEKEIMHFRSGSLLILIAGFLIAASAVSALVAGISSRGTAAERQIEFPGASAVFFTFLPGLLFVVYFISTMISSHGMADLIRSHDARVGTLEIIALFVSLICAAALLLRATTWSGGTAGTVLSLFPAIFMGLLMFVYYFDMNTAPINSPEKGMTNVLLSAALLFFLSDSRDRLGRISPVFAVFTRTTAAFITAPVAAARVILRFTSQLESPPFIVNALLLSVGLFALYLLVLTRRAIVREHRTGQQEVSPGDPERSETSEETINE